MEAPFPSASRRLWLLSPAAATSLFFVAQMILAVADPRTASEEANAAAAQAPAATPVKIQVVAEIRSVEASPRPTNAVPETEAQLLELLRREGNVLFFSDEVEVVTTPERRFDTDEVDVITADHQVRRAKLVRR